MMGSLPQEVQDSLGTLSPFPPRLGRPAEYAALAKSIVENVYAIGVKEPRRRSGHDCPTALRKARVTKKSVARR